MRWLRLIANLALATVCVAGPVQSQPACEGVDIAMCPSFFVRQCESDAAFQQKNRSVCMKILAGKAVDNQACARLDRKRCAPQPAASQDAPPPAPTAAPEPQSVDACISAATSSPGLSARIQQLQPAALRDAISERLASPPSCAPNPAAIKAITSCIEEEIVRIRGGYDTLQKRLAQSNNCRPQEYGETYKIFDETKTRANKIEGLIKQSLFGCTTDWQTWLDQRASRTGPSAPPADRSGARENEKPPTALPEKFARALTTLVDNLRNNLEEASTKETEIRKTVSGINESLDTIEANVAVTLLECK